MEAFRCIFITGNINCTVEIVNLLKHVMKRVDFCVTRFLVALGAERLKATILFSSSQMMIIICVCRYVAMCTWCHVNSTHILDHSRGAREPAVCNVWRHYYFVDALLCVQVCSKSTQKVQANQYVKCGRCVWRMYVHMHNRKMMIIDCCADFVEKFGREFSDILLEGIVKLATRFGCNLKFIISMHLKWFICDFGKV